MRVMVLVKANQDYEAGVLPSTEMISQMGKFNEELVKAGVMRAGEGPPAQLQGQTDPLFRGPADRDRWSLQRDQGIGWRFLALAGAVNGRSCRVAQARSLRPGPFPGDEEIEIRPVFAPEDFAPSDPTGELMEAEERVRAQGEENAKRRP
jgi:hypothetical protein